MLAALSAGCFSYALAPLAVRRPQGNSGHESRLGSSRRTVQKRLRARSAASSNAVRPGLAARLDAAGISCSPRAFIVVSMTLGCAAFLLLKACGASIVLAACAACIAGAVLPHVTLAIAAQRHQNVFREGFAPSLDMVVRAAQAGMPLNRCLQIAAGGGAGDVNAQLTKLAAELTADAPLTALKRFGDNARIPEARFFAFAMALQQETGGNLSVALGSLSAMLRNRAAFRAKVATLTAEARMSAMIIGSLPVIIAAALGFASPGYLTPLWTDPVGRICLYSAVLWVFAGVIAMRILIKSSFED